MTKIFLKKDKEKLPLNKHPWVFSGAVDWMDGKPAAGDIVSVFSTTKQFIAYGQFNPNSTIRVRLMEWKAEQVINDEWYRTKLEAAVALRCKAVTGGSNAYRLVFSEADHLPGIIIDRYGSCFVLQALTSGAERIKFMLAKQLMALFPDADAVVERSDGDGRRMEGLPESHELLCGILPKDNPVINEGNVKFSVDMNSQKTGFFADQRVNRLAAREFAAGKRVLDICCYTGAFSVHALQGGATSAVLCDASADALKNAKVNLEMNGFSSDKYTLVQGDAFEYLRELKKTGEQFDLIILDPPKLAPSRKDLDKGLRAYKDLNLNAMHLLSPGGYLVTFSCSGLVDMSQFTSAVAWAAKDSGRDLQIVQRLHQAPCHPLNIFFPESEYLKGLICKIS